MERENRRQRHARQILETASLFAAAELNRKTKVEVPTVVLVGYTISTAGRAAMRRSMRRIVRNLNEPPSPPMHP